MTDNSEAAMKKLVNTRYNELLIDILSTRAQHTDEYVLAKTLLLRKLESIDEESC